MPVARNVRNSGRSAKAFQHEYHDGAHEEPAGDVDRQRRPRKCGQTTGGKPQVDEEAQSRADRAARRGEK